jgi:hypothetical protein
MSADAVWKKTGKTGKSLWAKEGVAKENGRKRKETREKSKEVKHVPRKGKDTGKRCVRRPRSKSQHRR